MVSGSTLELKGPEMRAHLESCPQSGGPSDGRCRTRASRSSRPRLTPEHAYVYSIGRHGLKTLVATVFWRRLDYPIRYG